MNFRDNTLIVFAAMGLLLSVQGIASPCTVTEDGLVGWYGPSPNREYTHWVTWAGDGGVQLYDRSKVTIEALSLEGGKLRSDTIRTRLDSSCQVTAIEYGNRMLLRLETHLQQRNVRYGQFLAGLLLMPDHPSAGAVYIHGAGESDRDHPQLLQLALHLAHHDIALLLTDKRGSGRSGSDYSTADFHDFAADAAAGMTTVRESFPDEIPVGVIGLSQGGWVVPLLTGVDYDAAFGVILSGAGVRLAEQQRHIVSLAGDGMDLPNSARNDLARLLSLGERYAYSGSGWKAYFALREHLLTGPAAPIASLLPDDPEAPDWQVARNTWYMDPAFELANADVDVLMILGAEDEQQNIPVEETRRRILKHAPNVEIMVFPGMGHGLSTTAFPGTHPTVLDMVALWINEHASGEPRDSE